MLTLALALSLLFVQPVEASSPRPYFMGVADGYSLWLTDTSLEMRLNNGETAAMQFPRTPFAVSPDRSGARYSGVF